MVPLRCSGSVGSTSAGGYWRRRGADASRGGPPERESRIPPPGSPSAQSVLRRGPRTPTAVGRARPHRASLGLRRLHHWAPCADSVHWTSEGQPRDGRRGGRSPTAAPVVVRQDFRCPLGGNGSENELVAPGRRGGVKRV